jgi:TetR/AcrR family transcriptional repressor of nem operon
MEDAFFALVQRGQSEGDIATDKNARALARFLTSSLNGLLVLGKANPDREVLADISKTTITILD